jgi:hypothetical protein
MMKDIAIYGAGGFGREVFCLINKINAVETTWNVIGFFDDGKEKGAPVGHYGTVLGGISEVNAWPSELALVVAVGSTANMLKITAGVTNPKISFPNIIHPEVVFSDRDSMQMGQGNIV